MEKALRPEESLSIIQDMVQRSKINLKEGSFYYLLWGWLALGAAGVEYILLEFFQSPWHPIVWAVMGVGGGIASAMYSRKEKRSAGYTTYIDTAMKYIWLAFGAMMVIAILIGATQSWSLGYSLIIALYGMGTFISGGVLKFRPLMIGGALCWVITLVSLLGGEMFRSFPTMLIMLMLSLVIGYLIPGYALKNAEVKNDAA